MGTIAVRGSFSMDLENPCPGVWSANIHVHAHGDLRQRFPGALLLGLRVALVPGHARGAPGDRLRVARDRRRACGRLRRARPRVAAVAALRLSYAAGARRWTGTKARPARRYTDARPCHSPYGARSAAVSAPVDRTAPECGAELDEAEVADEAVLVAAQSLRGRRLQRTRDRGRLRGRCAGRPPRSSRRASGRARRSGRRGRARSRGATRRPRTRRRAGESAARLRRSSAPRAGQSPDRVARPRG